MIPKIIHYVWLGKNPMSRLNLRCIESWQKYMPNYKIMLWNEKNSPMEHSYVQAAIKHNMLAFAADYIRLWVLKKHGGIYMDTDMELIKNPELILNDLEFFSGYESINTKFVNCAIFGANKDNKIISWMLDYIDKNCIPKKQFVIIPAIASHIISQMPKNNSIKIFPHEYFYPYNPFDEQSDRQLMFSCITQNTYAIHHWEYSWAKNFFWQKIRTKLKKILHIGWQINYGEM